MQIVRPLTKRSKKGKLYTRPPDIQAAIAVALAQDLETLEIRAAKPEPRDPQYLPSEVLVHLVRNAIHRDEDRAYNKLLIFLLRRCMINLYKHIRDEQGFDASFVRDEVIGRLGELFGDDAGEAGADALDFYEIRFNRAFSKLRIDVVRAEAAKARSQEPLVEIEDVPEDESDDAILAKLSQALRFIYDPKEHVEIVELCRAIDALPTEEREAIVLRYVYGYEVESTNPAEVTVATRCNVSGRTIRSRLAAALARLRRFKEVPQ